MSTVAPPTLGIDHEGHYVRKIENVPGRLGPWPLNVVRARIGLPWKRRLAKASLLVPKVRYWEDQFLSLSDEGLLTRSMELRGKARGKFDLDGLLPEAFGLVSVAIQR